MYLFLLLEYEVHGNHVFWILSALELLLPYRHEHLIRNNGLMGAGIEIPLHETIVFNLDCAGTDHFLEQYPSGIFLLESSLSIVFRFHLGLPVGERTPYVSRSATIFPRLCPDRYCSKIQHHLGLIGAHFQPTIGPIPIDLRCASLELPPRKSFRSPDLIASPFCITFIIMRLP